MQDYTQRGEQKHILSYFGKQIGTFLDIGANDGVTFSMSRALAELGWSGVLVEPAYSAYQKLVHNSMPDGSTPFIFAPTPYVGRSGITCVNAAITPTDGPITLWESGTHLKKGDVALLSTTIPQERNRWAASGEKFVKTTVRGVTFATLMKECGQLHFDFISIDAEGADYSILEQIDLTAVGCRMLCVETNNVGNAKFAAYAAKHGMRLYYRNNINLIFVR